MISPYFSDQMVILHRYNQSCYTLGAWLNVWKEIPVTIVTEEDDGEMFDNLF